MEHTLCGITRILSIGEFGEFATITLEFATRELIDELREKKVSWGPNEVFADCDDKAVLGIIRVYPPTSPGARSRGSRVLLISPRKDLDLNVGKILRDAHHRYRAGVIDHHPTQETVCDQVPHVDVRTEIGASSTMILQYLNASDVALTTKLATALFLGIKTDTVDLLRGASSDDLAAYTRLLPMADLEVLQKITHGPLPDEYFEMLHSALQGAVRYEEVLVVDVGAVPQPDLLSVVSELMLRAKGTASSFATGTYEDCVYVSPRVRGGRRNAGKTLREIMGKSGYGGGHELAAGGLIRPEDGDVRRASREAIKRLLEVVDPPDRRGRRLCREQKGLLQCIANRRHSKET
jgi:hypothetical protein